MPSATLEGFGKRLDAIQGSSVWVALKAAREFAIHLSSRRWALFLRTGEDPDFRYVSGAGFDLRGNGAAAIPGATIEPWPIAHRVEAQELETLVRAAPALSAAGLGLMEALRLGSRAVFLAERPIEPRPSGSLETALASFGSRLDPTLARITGPGGPKPCASAEAASGLIRRMRTAKASHAVLAAFDATAIRSLMEKDLSVEPATYLSVMGRLASALLSETGGACVSEDSRLVIHVLTRTPPDPELLASQFATSLSRALGGFGKADLPILRFLVIHAEERDIERSVEGFLAPFKIVP
ncbi:MAG: hypothetical protein JXA15_10970 [Spirochaetales bacterium]|nr:hypothetical protein [Spirochaetales bacterium]